MNECTNNDIHTYIEKGKAMNIHKEQDNGYMKTYTLNMLWEEADRAAMGAHEGISCAGFVNAFVDATNEHVRFFQIQDLTTNMVVLQLYKPRFSLCTLRARQLRHISRKCERRQPDTDGTFVEESRVNPFHDGDLAFFVFCVEPNTSTLNK